MTAPIRWALPAIAVVATFVAILGGSNESQSVPAATVAVGAAGLALWDLVRLRLPESSDAPPLDEPVPIGGSEAWFQPGGMSQASIVLLLDRIDRSLAHPGLPNKTPPEVDTLSSMPWEQFLSYVESRITEIEAAP